MIENLLSFSAWQTSSIGLETTEFRLRPVVKQVLENQQLTLLSNGCASTCGSRTSRSLPTAAKSG